MTALGLLVMALLTGCQGATSQTATVQPSLPPTSGLPQTATAQAASAQPTAYPAPTTLPQAAAAQAVLPTAYPAPTGQPDSQPALSCTSPATLTPALTEGPYFKAGSPERTSLLETGMPGIKLVLTGNVLTPDCQPIAGALLEFWQADTNGQYDNSGYTLRGHQ
jgi:hypothetical protein